MKKRVQRILFSRTLILKWKGSSQVRIRRNRRQRWEVSCNMYSWYRESWGDFVLLFFKVFPVLPLNDDEEEKKGKVQTKTKTKTMSRKWKKVNLLSLFHLILFWFKEKVDISHPFSLVLYTVNCFSNPFLEWQKGRQMMSRKWFLDTSLEWQALKSLDPYYILCSFSCSSASTFPYFSCCSRHASFWWDWVAQPLRERSLIREKWNECSSSSSLSVTKQPKNTDSVSLLFWLCIISFPSSSSLTSSKALLHPVHQCISLFSFQDREGSQQQVRPTTFQHQLMCELTGVSSGVVFFILIIIIWQVHSIKSAFLSLPCSLIAVRLYYYVNAREL